MIDVAKYKITKFENLFCPYNYNRKRSDYFLHDLLHDWIIIFISIRIFKNIYQIYINTVKFLIKTRRNINIHKNTHITPNSYLLISSWYIIIL